MTSKLKSSHADNKCFANTLKYFFFQNFSLDNDLDIPGMAIKKTFQSHAL